MARRNKLTKFSEILSFPNVVENYDPANDLLEIDDDVQVDFKGKWRVDFFKNDKPLILELACGRGEYTLALARTYRENNYLGIDIKGARIWKGAKIALLENLTNAGFLRCKIEKINRFFVEQEIDEIWITFPDPFPAKENRRLTAPPFLDRYKQILKKGGLIHLKTDDDNLYEFTLTTINNREGAVILHASNDIYADALQYPELEHKTYYEMLHIGNGKKIKYIRFSID